MYGFNVNNYHGKSLLERWRMRLEIQYFDRLLFFSWDFCVGHTALSCGGSPLRLSEYGVNTHPVHRVSGRTYPWGELILDSAWLLINIMQAFQSKLKWMTNMGLASVPYELQLPLECLAYSIPSMLLLLLIQPALGDISLTTCAFTVRTSTVNNILFEMISRWDLCLWWSLPLLRFYTAYVEAK